jgi:hypothetical protein
VPLGTRTPTLTPGLELGVGQDLVGGLEGDGLRVPGDAVGEDVEQCPGLGGQPLTADNRPLLPHQ